MQSQRWANEYREMLNIAILRRRRRCRRVRNRPYTWTILRPAESWFDIHYNDPTIPQEYFRQQLILHILGQRLERRNTRFRNCLPPAKVLALGLYRLAHGNSYSSIGPVFNVGKSTVIEGVQDVVNGLYELRDEYIKFPETIAEVNASIATFAELTNLPNVVGAIDGSHIRIKAPNDSAPDYFSRYQQHDFIIQAIVDGKKIFMDFACGYPGSMHDARVLRRNTIFQRAENGNILTQPTVNVTGHDIGPYLLGDSAYPLSPWLMKPYPEGTRDPREIAFNKELSSARVKVECAFGVLKSRWRILLKRFDSGIPFAVRNAVACAVLHNISIRSGDEWEDEEGEDDCDPGGPPPNVIRDGDNIREVLKDFL
ncbi:uncharacterized protein [Montipora capricornis]|uniref:uncharacterized protein isoform X2 n=1 Tax=Montipora capricornis TaxID=246305 RepID=UPI0035F1F6BA